MALKLMDIKVMR